jgi:hypothetical protein
MIEFKLDPQNMPEALVEAGARSMAGLSWIDHLVDRRWEDVPQEERDYWMRFFKAGLLGLMAEKHRQDKSAGSRGEGAAG